MGKLPLLEFRDAVLEPFRVLLAGRRAMIRRRRHGRRSTRDVRPAAAPPGAALAIGDAVLCDD
jgi:hypothetical protein